MTHIISSIQQVTRLTGKTMVRIWTPLAFWMKGRNRRQSTQAMIPQMKYCAPQDSKTMAALMRYAGVEKMQPLLRGKQDSDECEGCDKHHRVRPERTLSGVVELYPSAEGSAPLFPGVDTSLPPKNKKSS